MDNRRRRFIKNVTAATAGVTLGSMAFGNSSVNAFSRKANGDKDKQPEAQFPFYPYVKKYNFGDYLPKDQGGKFIQMQLIDSEDDHVIVKAIRNGLLQRVYGDPIGWGKLEKTELEKSVWLNRFYYLPSFARLYYLSGDESYLEDMMKLIRVWIHDNPRVTEHPTSKYNWYDMQVAWRSIHLSWCYYLGEKGLSIADKQLIKDTLKEHALVLAEGFGQQKLNEFNHQAHGALAMIYLGTLFPELSQAEELRTGALRILEHHINFAFYPDGGNVEQMFGYYPFEASIFRDTYLLCRDNGVTPPKNILPLLHKMADYLFEVAQPDGTMPPVNDSYPMPVNPTETIIREILNEKVSADKKPGSYYLPETQIGVMRANGSGLTPWYLLANPARTIGSHDHAGRLGFVLWYGEEPVLIDSGCSNYDNPLIVKWYRTSRAHNTVLIDGKQDAATSSDRQWAGKRQTDNRITDWEEKPDYKLVRMVSPASDPTNSNVQWTRNLAFIRNKYMLIHDHFKASEKHNYELLLHLLPVEVETHGARKSVLLKTDHPMAIIPANAESYDDLSVGKGYVNLEGTDRLAPVVSYSTSGADTHSVLLVAPVKENASEWKVKQELLADGLALTIEGPSDEKDTILFRKPGASSISYKGHQTSDWMAVF